MTGEEERRPRGFQGTQAERTEMAWVRTALACAGLAALATRLVATRAELVVTVVLGLLVAVPGLVASWWRVGGLRTGPQPAPPRVGGAALLAGSVALVDVAVLVRIVL